MDFYGGRWALLSFGHLFLHFPFFQLFLNHIIFIMICTNRGVHTYFYWTITEKIINDTSHHTLKNYYQSSLLWVLFYFLFYILFYFFVFISSVGSQLYFAFYFIIGSLPSQRVVWVIWSRILRIRTKSNQKYSSRFRNGKIVLFFLFSTIF